MELYLDNKQENNNQLISEQDWINLINTLQSQVTEKQLTEQEITNILNESLINAIKNRIPKTKFGILFSGGIDSTLIALICKHLNLNFTCYTVGLENSPDVIASKKIAEKYNLNHKIKILDLKTIENSVKKLKTIFKNIPKNSNLAVLYGVGIVVYEALNLAKQENTNILFAGLGSEEIFAGYHRHEKGDANEECWRGLKLMWQRDLLRDFTIGKKLGIQLRLPFLDDNLILAAMGIPSEKKISKEHKKIILREIAEELGLPKEIAWRQKKAAQYGSGFDKVMEKLAKKAKLSKSEYVLHLT